MFLLPKTIALVLLTIGLLLSSEALIPRVPFVALGGVLAAVAALVLGLRNVPRSRPRMTATGLALCGCILPAVPAGFMLWAMPSHWSSQARSKAEQAEPLRRFPSRVVYVPDTRAMPPGTEAGPFLDPSPEDGEPRIEQIYQPPDKTRGSDPAQITSIHVVQRPDARDLVRRRDDDVAEDAPGCEIIARTPKVGEIWDSYAPDKMPQ